MKILYLPSWKSQQRQLEKKVNIYPVRMAMEAELYRWKGHEVYWYNLNGDELTTNHIRSAKLHVEGCKVIRKPEMLPFLSLPKPDRIFTNAKSYTSGDYKYTPGTHILSASGCSYGKCSFCVEKDSKYLIRPVDSVINEIKECKKLGFREVFDDSATFPSGEWLKEFCKRKIEVGLGDFPISCNMRVSRLEVFDYMMMKEAGFRMVLFGIESANQKTLDKINKGTNTLDIKLSVMRASRAGLEPHICSIVGFPWESDEDAQRTLQLVKCLLKKGYAKTAQMSLYSPNGNETQHKYVKKIYDVKYSPQFWFNQLKDIRNKDDIKYLWRKIKAGLE